MQQQLKHFHHLAQQEPRWLLVEEIRSAVSAARAWARRVARDTPQALLAAPDAEVLTGLADRAATRAILEADDTDAARRLADALGAALARRDADRSFEGRRDVEILRTHEEALIALADRMDSALDLRAAIRAAAEAS